MQVEKEDLKSSLRQLFNGAFYGIWASAIGHLLWGEWGALVCFCIGSYAGLKEGKL